MRISYPIVATLLLACVAASGEETVRLSKERYLDKCKGAWAGQMAGVCFGAPYEFRSNAKPITDTLRPWEPDRITGAIMQDDCYVEMTFLKAIEEYGLDITFEQAGLAFADTEYRLWHANRAGRDNIRQGVMPPKSGHPNYNRHADDIDFQIEADLLGILCPGLPLESNRLSDIFGHVMNYGDGVYGGMFVAGMYAAAYFEDHDVDAVVHAGLACIPTESLYHRCVSDVVRWHKESPDDWLIAWHKIEEKWQDDVDCMPGNAFNIDAKLNGAYIAMGLLYGEGDMLKTLDVSTRCGQDADCNPSNAAGVLGCMKGFGALGEYWTGGIAAIADKEFSYTDYSFNTLIPACQKVTEAIIHRAGGSFEAGAYVIPRQNPRPPQTLEQWTDQMAILSIPILPHEIAVWNPAWSVVACGHDMEPGVRPKCYGRDNVLLIHPVNRDTPGVISAELDVPAGNPTLAIDVASDRHGDFVLKVVVEDKTVRETVVDTRGKWMTVTADLTPHAGKTVSVRIENRANGWTFEAAYLDNIELR